MRTTKQDCDGNVVKAKMSKFARKNVNYEIFGK